MPNPIFPIRFQGPDVLCRAVKFGQVFPLYLSSFVLTLMVYLPKSTEFLMASFRVYEAMVISRFIELSLMWYGGENKLMSSLPEGATVRYNLPPLCCCFFCLNNKLITRKRIKIFRFAG